MLKTSNPKVKLLRQLFPGGINLSKEAHLNKPSLVSIALQHAEGLLLT